MSESKYVNIIESQEDIIQSNTLFVGDDASERAEARFIEMVKEQEPDTSKELMDSFLDDGHYESGDWSVWLTHPIVEVKP